MGKIMSYESRRHKARKSTGTDFWRIHVSHTNKQATSNTRVAKLMIMMATMLSCGAGASTNSMIKPPERIHANLAQLDSLTTKAQHLLRRDGYVLLEGLESMTAEEMRTLAAALAGDSCTMLKFNNGEFGDSCASAAVPEVRVLGRGTPNALLADIGYEWHQDGGGTAPFLTLLHCKVACAGADTLFADGSVLFNRLSSADQARARSLTAVYSNVFTAGGPTALDAAHGLRMSSCGTRRVRPAQTRKPDWKIGRFRRPLVETVGGGGIERLCCGAKGLEHLEGMDSEESSEEVSRLLRTSLGPHDEAMLDEDLRTAGRTLFATEAVYVHRWTRGEAMLFDNHRMLHSTSPIACYAQGEPRLMWQVICKAEMSFRDDQVL